MLKTFYLAVLVWEICCFQWGTSDFLEKKYFSSVTHTTHKETSAVSDPGMLGQVRAHQWISG